MVSLQKEREKEIAISFPMQYLCSPIRICGTHTEIW